MRFFSTLAFVASVVLVSGQDLEATDASLEERAVLRCKPNLRPFCCSGSFGLPVLGGELGMDCRRARYGGKDHCGQGQVKVCCSKTASSLGPVTLCDVGSFGGLGGLGGGFGGIP